MNESFQKKKLWKIFQKGIRHADWLFMIFENCESDD